MAQNPNHDEDAEAAKLHRREEHLEWAKKRALEYLDAGDIMNAITSMLSDLEKHPATKLKNQALYMLAMIIIRDHDEPAARRFITGFR